MEELNTIGTIEAFTHSLRGVMVLFFFYWSYRLYPFHRQWMARLLFWATFYVACCYVKDGLLMVEGWKNDPFLINLITVIDLPFVPLISAFFLEICYPGWLTRRYLAVAFTLQALLIPIYMLYPMEWVCRLAYALAFSIAWVTLILAVKRYCLYHRLDEKVFAYANDDNLQWIVWDCLLFFVTLLIYYGCFEKVTWGSELLFNAINLLMWYFPYRYVLETLRTLPLDSSEEKREMERMVEQSSPHTQAELSPNCLLTQAQIEQIGNLLQTSMEHEKIFLNPKLTLLELAYHIDINKTYLSFYLNQIEGVTFYEYMNRFRVEEACVRIDTMLSQQDRKPLSEVSRACGFNSVSTFNRAFFRLRGITPGDYLRQQQAKYNGWS